MHPDDPMWKEFRPLWSALPVKGNQVHLAGGYGLFLKQLWLLDNPHDAIVIPFDRWQDTTPRATNDLDIVIGLDLIASAEAQGALVQAIERNEFKVVESNPRWQFQKQIGPDRRLFVDLHAELPKSVYQNLALDRLRIKHKPSLGDVGVHGRQNPQAAGCHIHPFLFELDGMAISVPNPVTWSVMKLISVRDRRQKSQEVERNEQSRVFHGNQATKHAQDVTRLVAMTTRPERDRAPEVVARIRNETSFIDAVEACDQLFLRDDGWGAQVAARMWRPDDFKLIQTVLKNWFGGQP